VTPDHHKTLEDVQAENAVLKEELAKLQKQLERLEQEHQEHVEVLKFQVKAHRDDWEAERSEKQQALQDKAAMERQVKELQRDVRSLKLKVHFVAGCIINFIMGLGLMCFTLHYHIIFIFPVDQYTLIFNTLQRGCGVC
jgi:vacuolar-type H+-ATPase subunit I/STV1